jgi:hypothetical protein
MREGGGEKLDKLSLDALTGIERLKIRIFFSRRPIPSGNS